MDFTTANNNVGCGFVALGGTIEGSTVAIRQNKVASVTPHTSNSFNYVLGLSSQAAFRRSSVSFASNKLVATGTVYALGAIIAVATPNEVVDADDDGVDWSTVTDKQARDTYGKSSFEIADNVLEAETYVTAWQIEDYTGGDWTIRGNSAQSTKGEATGYFSFPSAYYGISIAVDGNTLTAKAADQTSYIYFVMPKLPSNSAVRANGNTLVSGLTSDVAAFVLVDETWVPRGSEFAIENNVLAAPDGRRIDLDDQYVVDYQFAGTSAQSTPSAPVVLCGNTVFGNKITTNALVDDTIKSHGANLLVADADNCVVRRRSAAPPRAALAAGALASLAVAGAALLVL